MKEFAKKTGLACVILCLLALSFVACGDCRHKETDWIVDIEATCAVAGTKRQVCLACNETLDTKQYETGHSYQEGHCTYCGKAQYGNQYLQYQEITLNGEAGYAVVDMGNCGEVNLEIPAIHQNKPVLAIAASAFEKNAKLQTITIGQNVATIGEYAFAECENLKAVTFVGSSELQTIGTGAFARCTQIEAFAFPAGVTTIPSALFEGCTGLTTVTVHDNITSMGDDVFAECDKLVTVARDGVYYLGTETAPTFIAIGLANQNAVALTLPEGTRLIASHAFDGAKTLTSVALPQSLLEIGSYAFAACENLSFPTLPAGLCRIGEYAFAACKAFDTVRLPDAVAEIGKGAFRDCTGLTSVSLPAGIRHVGALAFLGCDDAIYRADNGGYYLGNAENPYLVLVKIDAALTAFTPHANTRVIADSACAGAALARMTVHEGIVALGAGAFANCSALTDVVFANTAGWHAAAAYGSAVQEEMTVTDAAANAAALTGAYRNTYWSRLDG